MCIVDTPDAPPPPPVLPEAPVTPDTGTSQRGGDRDKRRRRAAAGQTGNVATGAGGLTTDASTTENTLLGS